MNPKTRVATTVAAIPEAVQRIVDSAKNDDDSAWRAAADAAYASNGPLAAMAVGATHEAWSALKKFADVGTNPFKQTQVMMDAIGAKLKDNIMKTGMAQYEAWINTVVPVDQLVKNVAATVKNVSNGDFYDAGATGLKAVVDGLVVASAIVTMVVPGLEEAGLAADALTATAETVSEAVDTAAIVTDVTTDLTGAATDIAGATTDLTVAASDAVGGTVGDTALICRCRSQ